MSLCSWLIYLAARLYQYLTLFGETDGSLLSIEAYHYLKWVLCDRIDDLEQAGEALTPFALTVAAADLNSISDISIIMKCIHLGYSHNRDCDGLAITLQCWMCAVLG